MKIVNEYISNFIDNMIITKDLITNSKLMCKEYDSSHSKLIELKKEREECINNICNRLNYLFGINPNWYRKGFRIKKDKLEHYYEINIPKIDRKSKEYYCLRYMYDNLHTKYTLMSQGGSTVTLHFRPEVIKIENILKRY